MFLRLVLTVAVAMLSAACYDSGFSSPGSIAAPPVATTTIQNLSASFAGQPFRVDGDIVVEGRITTSDSESNFYRSLFIEDNGAALELMAGLDHLHNAYPEGYRVSLRLKGLTVARSRGVLQVGYESSPGSGYATDYIPSREALDKHLILHDVPPVPVAPLQTAISGLKPEMCGRLVRINALRLVTDEEMAQPATWAGEHLFIDAESATIKCYVRNYARFSDREIPSGEGSIVGILHRVGDTYQLKPRYGEDLRF